MKQFRYIIYLLLSACLIFPVTAQQTRSIKGSVLDEKSEPIIGASITVPGTKSGTITDINGKFSLNNIPENQKNIQISYIGYNSQTVDIQGKVEIRIVLAEASSELDEVIIVGYGAQKKAHLTGAIATVTPNEIRDLSVTNLGEALVGQINGLSVNGGDGRPGEATRLSIRQSSIVNGFSSGATDPSPLYVIDDFISTETAFNNLDASVIESISVLKDASAAVYGSRAAMGVIVVRTKRGDKGAPKVSYNGQFGYTDEIYRSKMLDAYNYGLIWNGVKGATTSNNSDIDKTNDFFQADELNAMKGLNYDLLEQYWKPAITQKHSINVSGGTDRSNYFAGLSYVTQEGNLGAIDYTRWNYRAGMDSKIGKGLKISLQLAGDYGETNTAYNKIGGSSSETDYNTLLTHPRYIPDYVNGLPTATYGVSNSLVDDIQHYNFDAVQNLNNYSTTKPQNMTINSTLEYDFGWSRILKGLKLKMAYSKGISTSQNNQLGTNVTVYKILTRGGSGNHLYTSDDLDLSASNFQKITESNGNSVRRTMSRRDNYQLNFIATYDRTFGQHDVSGLFTIEKAESETEDLEGTVLDPLSFTDGQSKSATGTKDTGFGRSESGMLSYVGRVNYAFNDKYLLEVLIRSDASTKFAYKYYWGTFPSLSAGWIISEENWYNIKGMDFLKLRGSAGLTGNDNIPAWRWLQLYNRDVNKGAVFGTTATNNIGAGISSSDAPNPDAHWTKSYKVNGGIDTRFIDARLSATLDGYYEWNRDVFMSRTGASTFPSTLGTQPTSENFGKIDTYGIELSLNWKDKISSDLKYSIGINTGYSDNRLLEKAWESLIPIYGQHPGERTDVGEWGLECIGMFRSYQEIEEYFEMYMKKEDGTYGTYLGNTKDNVYPGMLIYRDIRGTQNPDGTYNGPDHVVDKDYDLVQISNRSNPYGFTVNAGLEWKDFSFKMQIGANWGGYSFVPKTARMIQNLISSGGSYTDMQYTNLPSFWAENMFVYENILDVQGNVVAPQNLDAKYPNLRYSLNGETSTFWKVSGTRASIRNITIAYSLPKALAKKLTIESCRFNLTAQNVLSLYNPYPDNFMDPMTGNYGNYPVLRKITLGVNVSF